MHDKFTPIIGLTACEQRKLIEIKENNIEFTSMINIHEYNAVFDGKIRTFEGEYFFEMKDWAKANNYAKSLSSDCSYEKSSKRIRSSDKTEIIKPVEAPTGWVNQTINVKKPDGSIRICLDPQELNKVHIHERYCLPTLQDTLHELTQSAVFSKFGIAQGYWHIK